MTLSFAKLQRTLAKRVPPGFANRMTARRPTRWREVLPVAGYAAGGIVVGLLLWQVGAKLFSEDRYRTAGFEAVALITLPPYPGTSQAVAAPDRKAETTALTVARQPGPATAATANLERAEPAPIPMLHTPGRPEEPGTVAADRTPAPLPARTALDGIELNDKLAPMAPNTAPGLKFS